MICLDDKLEGMTSVGISGHVRPDGDCVGSTLAVYNYIKTYYPQMEVKLYLEAIPSVFYFLKNADEICHNFDEDKCFDLFIVLDCGDKGRLGPTAKYYDAAKHTLCIDHHVSNQAFAEGNYIIPDASSTCELVFDIIETQKITKEIAECLYMGIAHDTGIFQYSCTSPKTMNTAGVLMGKGIDYAKIVADTYYLKTYDQNRILGHTLLKSKLYLGGKAILSYLTREELNEFHCTSKDLEGIVNQLRVTEGTEVAVFLYECEDGSFKVSFRVSGNLNVAEIAQIFGGGGHVKAAGCNIFGTIEEITERVLSEIEKRL